MKKMLFLVLMMVILSVGVAFANENDEIVTVRKAILITGEFQRYMPLPFTVNSINCANIEVSEYKQSYPFFGQVAKWEKKYFGEKVPAGLYRFNVTDADLSKCAPVMNIFSEVPKWVTNTYLGGFLEVEPEDLGLLVKGGNNPGNVFNLETDDSKFSYELVSMSDNTERELASFIFNTTFFSDTGNKKIVGAIVSDNRGFLKKKIMFNMNPRPERIEKVPYVSFKKGRFSILWKEVVIPAESFISPQDNVIIRDEDTLVLIRKED